MTRPPFSVIVPAHDEAAVIERCLSALLENGDETPPEIVIVANGCFDDTAAVACAFAKRQPAGVIRVIDTQQPGKANALNLGDAAATTFPRFFVDADIVVTYATLLEVARRMQEQNLLAAAPAMKVDLADRPWAVRAFYRTWLTLPYCRTSAIGSGVYGISEQGHARLMPFPNITADDAYARLQFTADERRVFDHVHFSITPPRTLGLIRAIKTRAHFGNLELRHLLPATTQRNETRHTGELLSRLLSPKHWLRGSAAEALLYLSVMASAKRRAKQRWRRGEHAVWERDDSSRAEAAL